MANLEKIPVLILQFDGDPISPTGWPDLGISDQVISKCDQVIVVWPTGLRIIKDRLGIFDARTLLPSGLGTQVKT